MLDTATRTAILALGQRGLSQRQIVCTLSVSREAVLAVLTSGNAAVPAIERVEKAQGYRDDIVALYPRCKGNLVRVHEELVARGAELSYPALTAFCRRHHLLRAPKPPVGHYEFEPGEEMQHDTSPHRVRIAGQWVPAQTASLVLAYSRMTFIQIYPRFDRFTCKVFLQDALVYFGGSARRCLIDNTSVVVLSGTGKHMVPVPEMKTFGERLGFFFAAHPIGDANRKARVERNFDFADNNFLAGREFSDWADLNQQARCWSDRINQRFVRSLHAKPVELFQKEKLALKPLPEWLPPVYRLHQRIVNTEGCVSLHRHQYSVPYDLIDRQVQVRETKDTIVVSVGPRQICQHPKIIHAGRPERMIDPSHRPPRGERPRRSHADALERRMRDAVPEIGPYLDALKTRAPGRGLWTLRRLHALVLDYPKEPLVTAIATAQHYRLYDLERLERMVLRNIATDFFPPTPDSEPPHAS